MLRICLFFLIFWFVRKVVFNLYWVDLLVCKGLVRVLVFVIGVLVNEVVIDNVCRYFLGFRFKRFVEVVVFFIILIIVGGCNLKINIFWKFIFKIVML